MGAPQAWTAVANTGPAARAVTATQRFGRMRSERVTPTRTSAMPTSGHQSQVPPCRAGKRPYVATRADMADRLYYSGVTYAAVIPPSTTKVEPVMNEDSSEARNSAALAIS